MSRLIFLLAALLGLAAMAASNAAAVQKQFIIFFHEGDRERLDPKQWLVIPAGVDAARDAAQGHKEIGGAILLIGNDQRVGGAQDALVRSQRRADAVRDLLVSFGVSASAVVTRACGYSKPLVEAPPNVSEIQNRYVMIDLRVSKADATAAANAACPGAS